MKKFRLFLLMPTALLIVASIFVIIACGAEDPDSDEKLDERQWVTISPRSLSFPGEGGKAKLKIESGFDENHEVFTFDEDMLTIEPENLYSDCKDWIVTCAPNYRDVPRETMVYGESMWHGEGEYRRYCYDSIRVYQDAGGLPAKLANIKLLPEAIGYEIRNEDSYWRFDDDATMTPLPFTSNIRGLSRGGLEMNKKNATTSIVDGKYKVDLDIEYVIDHSYSDNIPSFGANYLSNMKLSLLIGVDEKELFFIEKGTLYFNEEGVGSFTNPTNGQSGASEEITHVEVALSNIPCGSGPESVLENNIREIKFDSYWNEQAIITGTGYKKFYAMPNNTDVKPATAKSGDNKQWRFKLTLIYAD